MTTRDRIACVAALLPILAYGIAGDYETPELWHLAALLAAGAALAGAIGRQYWAACITLALALALGVHERLLDHPFNGNDVMLATDEALKVLAGGGNPYAHAYTATNPPGQPFAYPPGELLFYGLARLFGADIFGLDRWAGIGILFLLAALAPLAGPALTALAVTVAALAGQLAFSATNGSNDTAASFLALIGIVLLAYGLAGGERRARVAWWCGAVAFGWALAFKETTGLVYLAVLAFIAQGRARERGDWRAFLAASLGPATAISLPFVVWNPLGFWRNVVSGLFVHENVWGRNVWAILTAFSSGVRDAVAPFIPGMMLVVLCLVGMWCARVPARSLGGAVLQGCALLGVLFAFGRWTTWTYYVQLAPLLLAGVALALSEHEGEAARSSIVSAR